MELECKVAVDSHEPVRSALRAAGAAFIGRVLETNRLFDRADGSLRNTGCGLRVRSVVVHEGTGPGGSVTFKGPLRDSAFKLREEIETQVADPDAMTALLAALGYQSAVIFEKRRETWRLGDCVVELDELPLLGLFVEVEGPAEGAIRAAVERLGLSAEPVIRESYVAMIARAAKPGPGGRIRSAFGS